MKVIKTAAMVVGAVALVASGVGAIAGGTAFLAATGVSLATVSAIGTVAGLVGTVANAISPPKAAKGTVGGSQTDFKLDPNAGIPYLMGRTFAGGNIAHRDTWGTDNQYQGFVVTYSGGGTLQRFESFLVEQSNYGLNGDAVGGTYNGWMWNRLTLPGTPAGPVTSPVAGFPGLDNDFRMSGHATGVVVVKFDVKNGKKFSGGVPRQGVVAIGERVYDPRQDSTFPGGNGPCRALDEATYVGGAAAENPWCHALTWALGRWQNGKRVMGVGQRIRSIDVQTFVDAMNVADANGWTIGGVVYSIDNKWDVLRQMSQAGGGQCLRLGARLAAVVNAPKVALTTINETDLTGRASVSSSQTYRDRLNGMIPKFRSEAHGWEIVPASVVRVASYVEADGEEKTREWPLPMVQAVKQAGEITAYELVNRREFGPITIPTFIRFMGYKPGDAVNLNVGSIGLVNQLAVIRKRQIDPTNGNVQFAMVSETTEKHPFALGQTSVAPPIPDLSVPDESVVAAPQASDWNVDGGELEKDGVKTPAVILTGDVRNPVAEGFLVETRPVAGAEWAMVGQYPAKTTRVDILNVAAAADYYVAVSFVRRGVVGERVQLGPVKAGISVSGGAYVIPDDGVIGGSIDPITGKPVGGRPVPEVLGDLERVPLLADRLDLVGDDVSALKQSKVDTDAALALLEDAQIDADANARQLERDAGRLSEAVLRLVNESGRTRAVLRDAGFVVDPVSGAVRIYAIDQLADRTAKAEITLDAQKAQIAQRATVDYVNEQVAAAVLDPVQAAQLEPIIRRISAAETLIDGLNATVQTKASVVELTTVGGRVRNVEQGLDAANGLITSKAEKTDVDLQGVRLGAVEQTLSTIGDVSGISVTIRQARYAADKTAEAALSGLLAADDASRRVAAAAAQANQDLFTKVTDGLSAEATARLALSVQVGDALARTVEETTARIEADKLLSRQIVSLGVADDEQAAAIATLTEASIENGSGFAGIRTTIRQQSRDEDQTAEALLSALIAGDQSSQRRASELVQIQQELTTSLTTGQAAEAAARFSILARMDAAEAGLVNTSRVLADTKTALTSRIELAEAVIGDAATGLAATRARIIREEEARAEGDRANARAVELLSAQVNNPDTGLPATLAAVGREVEARAAGDQAAARSLEQVSARVDGVEGSVSDVREVLIGPDGTTVQALTVLDNNGRVVGVRQTNDGTTGNYEITSDVFAVVHPDTGVVLFYVDGNGAMVGKLKVGTVEADTIVGGAVSRTIFQSTNAPVVIQRT